MAYPLRCTHLPRRTVIALLGLSPLASRAQSLSPWVLQIPGPLTIKDLDQYTSKYFRRLGGGRLCFSVDCAEGGTTRNSEYVRSELRHRVNWPLNVGTKRMLAGRISVNSNTSPDKVTVMQIHGIGNDGSNVPPLLRIALDEGDLIAHIKSDAEGKTTEHVRLSAGINRTPFDCKIIIDGSILTVFCGDQQAVQRDLSFWHWDNYFKLGCYPQAHHGVSEIIVENVKVAV